EVFTRIYRNNEWGSDESRSGQGSTRARGAEFRAELAALFESLGVTTLVDAPCGDFNWMRDLEADRLRSYTGVDIVEELVAANRARYGAEGRQFLCGDLTRDPLPRADLILCRDGLVHLSYADIRAAIRNFKRSGSRYLLTTTFDDIESNSDVPTGSWRALNLRAAPFAFPPPLASLDDAPLLRPGKRLALWELASLPD
ncbi:MAG TPA: class I SAM-dependent methyltransferase, partial [Thermoanaerobaculia bacterium]|nr:class I SAM-dependent methyltransferase [Thermoanaerobaculia bacterium]